MSAQSLRSPSLARRLGYFHMRGFWKDCEARRGSGGAVGAAETEWPLRGRAGGVRRSTEGQRAEQVARVLVLRTSTRAPRAGRIPLALPV